VADYYVYLVKCGDGTLYCGIAKDVEKRVAMHNAGKGAKYTRGRSPVILVASSGPYDKSTALRLELKVKRARKDDKTEMVMGV
jgi:putative endonuclease